MSPEEAISRIKNHNEVHSRKEKHFAVHITEALNMAVDALEKQIPKKPRTQFDRIKAMDIKEMAMFMAERIMQQKDCKRLIEETPNITATHLAELKRQFFMQCLRWLESEVEEE